MNTQTALEANKEGPAMSDNQAWRISINVFGLNQNDAENAVIVALQQAGLEIIPESVWSETLAEATA